MSALLAGFSLGFSLILAIGAQNAFVLKQGLRQEHVFLTSLICALSDALLITAGVLGFGAIVKAYPQIELIARFGGAAFLIAYGLKSFYAAYRSDQALVAEGATASSALKVALTCLAFTWLNPHVYLDTVFLLGAISVQYGEQQDLFGIGAVCASFVFFFSLGYGARVLRPLFAKPKAWRVLDLMIGAIMITLATNLLV
jgi:L-lysine exporter family protein LysE/ArgO